MSTRFGRFFAGDFQGLVDDIMDSNVYTKQSHEDKSITKAEGIAKEGLISKAVRTLDTRPPAPATRETFDSLQALHPQPSEPLISAIPPGTPRNVFTPSDRAIVSAVKHSPNKVKAGPTNWTYKMLKGAVSSDPTTDISAFSNIITKFCTGTSIRTLLVCLSSLGCLPL